MEETRIQIQFSFRITGRTGRMASTQLLSGKLEEDAEPMEMVSEAVGDRWGVSLMGGFMDPPSPKRQEVWDRGERGLWVAPRGEMRELIDGEIFRAVHSDHEPVIRT